MKRKLSTEKIKQAQMLIDKCPLQKQTIDCLKEAFKDILNKEVSCILTFEASNTTERQTERLIHKDFEKYKQTGYDIINMMKLLYSWGLTSCNHKIWFVQVHIQRTADSKSTITYKLHKDEAIAYQDPFNFLKK